MTSVVEIVVRIVMEIWEMEETVVRVVVDEVGEVVATVMVEEIVLEVAMVLKFVEVLKGLQLVDIVMVLQLAEVAVADAHLIDLVIGVDFAAQAPQADDADETDLVMAVARDRLKRNQFSDLDQMKSMMMRNSSPNLSTSNCYHHCSNRQ